MALTRGVNRADDARRRCLGVFFGRHSQLACAGRCVIVRPRSMNRPWTLPFAVAFALLGGCQSPPALSGDVAVRPLDGPYELRLTLDRRSSSPGERVNASIEFENTGSDVLWIPRQREVFFGFEQKGPFEVSSEEGESSCDGLQYVRVRPGQKVRYEKEFAAPGIHGEVSVYITADRRVSVPLLVK